MAEASSVSEMRCVISYIELWGYLYNFLRFHTNYVTASILWQQSESYIFPKFVVISHENKVQKRVSHISLWNSASFDRWTISVGQVVPEIDPPHTAFQISHQIYTDHSDDQKPAKKRGIARIRGQFHCLIIPFNVIGTILSKSQICFATTSSLSSK